MKKYIYHIILSVLLFVNNYHAFAQCSTLQPPYGNKPQPICVDDFKFLAFAFPVLYVSLPSGIVASSYKWYNPLGAVVSTSSSYTTTTNDYFNIWMNTPPPSNIVSYINYQVSYVVTDPITHAQCESPKATVQIMIVPQPLPPTIIGQSAYCLNASTVPLSASFNGSSPWGWGISHIEWYPSPPPYPNTSHIGGSIIAPTPSTAAVGAVLYYATTVDGNNCESYPAYHQVTVSKPKASTVTASVCQGSSYAFNGANYSTSGTYTSFKANANGCDDTLILDLKVNQPTSATVTASICQGSSYTFNGTNYTTAGTYTILKTNAAGCDSTITLNLKVNQPTTSTVNATISKGKNYLLNGINYSTAGTYIINKTNVVGCDSTITLNLSVTQSADTTICKGGTALLKTNQGGNFQGWTPATAVADPTKPQTTASPIITTTYIGKTMSTSLTNLVTSGDFEGTNSANIKAYTQYSTWPGIIDLQAGEYAVAKSPNACHGSLGLFPDHTNGTGNMMVFNGNSSTSTLVWTQTIPTNPNTNYSFSTWIASAYPINPASLQFSINGTLIGSSFNASSTVGQWQQFYATWNSGTATNAVISIVNQNTNSNGNDFALDDISFSTYNIGIDTVNVIVDNPPIINLKDTSICQGNNVVLDAGTGMDSYLWSTGASSQKITVAASGMYITTVTLGVCNKKDTVIVTVKQPSSSTTNASICLGDNYSFNGKTYTTAGTFSAKLVNAVGCDSTATLVLNIKNPSISTTNASICFGDSYSFNGKTYSIAGTYSTKLVNAVGCDSIATLVLNIKNPTTSTTNASICLGDSYSFNGKTYTTAGTYSAKLVNAAGCDSTATLVLDIKNPTTSTTNASICLGDNYSFNGKTYSIAGTYSAKLTNAMGCDSTATLILNIKNPSTSTTNASICLGDSYSFNGKTYTTAGTYSEKLVNAVGCDSTATLVLNIKNPSTSTNNASICLGNSYSFNGKTYTTAGTYSAKLVNAVGCDSTATLVLNIKTPSTSSTNASICLGDNYSFNGKTYTIAGTYSAKLNNAVGCDSTATLVLNIKNPTTSSTNASICLGNSYSFNGKTYTAAGTYSAKLVNAVGCDSTATLTLNIKNPSTSTTNASICLGDNYSFNGKTYTAAGTYSAKLVNAVGCDSTATLVLNIKNPSTSTTNASICLGDSYSFNGKTYTTAGTYSAKLVNAVGCDSTATLVLSVKQPSSSITSTVICQGGSFYFNGTSYTTAGTYSAKLTNASGCDSIATLILDVKAKTKSTHKTFICHGDNYTFNGKTYTIPGTYYILLPNTAGCDSIITLIVCDKSPSASVTNASICKGESFFFNGKSYNTAGTYSALLKNTVGCDSIANLNVTVNQPSSSTTTATICKGDNFNFNGNNYSVAGTYSAKLINAVGCDSIATLVLKVNNPTYSTTSIAICEGNSYSFNGNTYNTAGTYSVKLINKNGCDSTATLVLTVYPISSTITANICEGNNYYFNGNSYTNAGTYSIQKTNSLGCDSTITLILNVKKAAFVKLIGDSLFCEKGLRTPYFIQTNDTSNTITWTVTGNNVLYSPDSKNPKIYRQVDWLSTGIDTITVSVDNGVCTAFDRMIVRIAPHSKPNFIWDVLGGTSKVTFLNKTEPVIITEGDTNELVPFNYFTWNFYNDQNTTYIQSNTSYSNDSLITKKFNYGYYPILLKSFNNYCIDSIIKTIFIDVEEGLFVPNSFVPGALSPELSHFRPKGFNLKTYSISIFDIWGNLLWYSDKLYNGVPAEGWNGIYNGEQLKLDSYIWKIDATFLDGSKWDGQVSSFGKRKSTFGNVLLMR